MLTKYQSRHETANILFVLIIAALWVCVASANICQFKGEAWELHNGMMQATFQLPETCDGSQTWDVVGNFNGIYQTVYGDAWCHTNHMAGVDDNGPNFHDESGANCWCRRTFQNRRPGPWIFLYNFGIAENCAYRCSHACAGCFRTGKCFIG